MIVDINGMLKEIGNLEDKSLFSSDVSGVYYNKIYIDYVVPKMFSFGTLLKVKTIDKVISYHKYK